MTGKLIFVLLCISILGCESASNAKCDCNCMYQHCKDGQKEHPADCDAIRKKCQDCGAEECNDEMLTCIAASKSKEETKKCVDNFFKCTDCMCKNKVCKRFVEKHGVKDRCAESLKICRNCDVRECNKEMELCEKHIQSDKDLRKCIDGWHKCGRCMCKYKGCKAHSKMPEKCETGLQICRNCDTVKCDAEQESCLQKSPGDTQKCAKEWYICVLKDCHKPT